MSDGILTQSMLQNAIRYNADTGIFTHAKNTRGARAGKVAGCVREDGYRRIKVCGVRYMAHRLAWLYVFGSWPQGQIDHRNEVKDDNRITNLRDVSQNINQHNRVSPKGYSFHRRDRKWVARITLDGKEIPLGRFACEVSARAAYLAAKKVYHPTAPRFDVTA